MPKDLLRHFSFLQFFEHTDRTVYFSAGGALPVTVAFLCLLMQKFQLCLPAARALHRLLCPQPFEQLFLFFYAVGIHRLIPPALIAYRRSSRVCNIKPLPGNAVRGFVFTVEFRLIPVPEHRCTVDSTCPFLQ